MSSFYNLGIFNKGSSCEMGRGDLAKQEY